MWCSSFLYEINRLLILLKSHTMHIRIVLFWLLSLTSMKKWYSQAVRHGFLSAASDASVIPNPSFEGYSRYPWSRKRKSCAEDWIPASRVISDCFNLCGCISLSLLGHDPPETRLPGGGAGNVGFHDATYGVPHWKEYIGAWILPS